MLACQLLLCVGSWQGNRILVHLEQMAMTRQVRTQAIPPTLSHDPATRLFRPVASVAGTQSIAPMPRITPVAGNFARNIVHLQRKNCCLVGIALNMEFTNEEIPILVG